MVAGGRLVQSSNKDYMEEGQLLVLKANGITPSPPSVVITEAEQLRRKERRQRGCACLSKYLGPERTALLAFVFLVGLAAAGERTAFKVAIDQMEPFRVFLAILVVLFFVLGSGVVVLYKKLCTNDITPAMDRFPRRSILLIALLDTLQLVVMVVSGASIPPVLSVLFMQATLPFIVIFSKTIFTPSKVYTIEHWKGASLILLGIAVAMAPTAYAAFWNRQIDIGINTIAYVCCCIPAAISQLVKERAIVQFSMPMNFYYLNFLLGLYQFIILLILSPLTYRLQGLGQGWSAYGRTDLGTAVSDLCVCLFTGQRIDPAKYPVAPECRFALLAVISYILCTLLVTFAVNGLLEYGSPLTLYRTLNGSVGVAFIVLAIYSSDQWGWFSPALNGFDFLGLGISLLGLELYHSSPEPDETFFTQFPSDSAYA